MARVKNANGNIYCKGVLCRTRIKSERKLVPKQGHECITCYSIDITARPPTVTEDRVYHDDPLSAPRVRDY